MKSWLKDIKGMWVATYTEGSMLGTVNNIYLDPNSKKVTGFIVRAGTPLAGEDVWVDINEVKKVGTDLIFLSNENSVRKSDFIGMKISQLVGMTISTKDGRNLGALSDIEVDRDTWLVTELGLASNQSVVVEPAETVIGSDFILVQAKAAVDTRSSVKKKEKFMESVLGTDFVKQTSGVIKRVLKGSEANLSNPARSSEQDAADSEQKE